MVDVQGYNSPHPRPLLPWNTAFAASQTLQIERPRYLPLEGYFEPTYIDVSTCQSVYVVVTRHIQSFCGIYTQREPAEAQGLCCAIDLSLTMQRKVKLSSLELAGPRLEGLLFLQVSSFFSR